ncbi:MAG: M15 family metallopeptidase [Erysipelotrichaceae bacterium]|nr:M15 family metallopeptidase [Erysipelotrichaceae bacterium]
MARHLSKRGWIVILSALLVILMGALCARVIFQHPVCTLKQSLEFEYGQKATVADLVSEVRRGELINGDAVIDTYVIGEKEAVISTKNHFGRQFHDRITVTVKDSVAPELEVPEVINYVRGENMDFISFTTASDNTGKVKVELINDYDLEKVGVQILTFRAYDPSGNETRKTTTLIVREDGNDNKKYFMTPNGYQGYTVVDGLTFIEGVPVINKTYGLPSSYGARGLTKDTNEAWKKMKEAAAEEGITLKVLSAYRNYGHQEEVFNKKVKEVGMEQALLTSEKAGHSEHQAGIALDVNSFKESFAETKEYEWLQKNCASYGFIIRYPKGKTESTGYVFEPWHITYVGEQWAQVFYNNGNWLCIEEYFQITSEYGE